MSRKPKKRYDPRDRWRSKYRKDAKLWIPSLKRTYLYWFKYLQICIKEGRKIDWEKYEGWGGANEIMGTKFDAWWEDHWKDLFGIKNEGDIPKFPLSTKRPKTDAIRYSLLLYQNKHKGSNWDIAVWTKKNEKRIWFIEFWEKIDEHMNTKTKLAREEQDKRVKVSEWEFQDNLIIKGNKDNKVERDEDYDAYLNRLDKEYVQSLVGRYLRSAEKYLKNVCKGEFP